MTTHTLQLKVELDKKVVSVIPVFIWKSTGMLLAAFLANDTGQRGVYQLEKEGQYKIGLPLGTITGEEADLLVRGKDTLLSMQEGAFAQPFMDFAILNLHRKT